MIINVPYIPSPSPAKRGRATSNLRGGGNYHSDHPPKSR